MFHIRFAPLNSRNDCSVHMKDYGNAFPKKLFDYYQLLFTYVKYRSNSCNSKHKLNRPKLI